LRLTSANDYTQPNFESMALVTIDLQRDFLRGQPAEIAGTSEILPQVARIADAFRRARLPIVHAVRLYRPDGGNVDLCRRRAVEQGARIVCPGTSGAELVSSLLPAHDANLDTDLLLSGAPQPLSLAEWAIYKPRWGAFFRTPLEDLLSKLAVTSLAIAGCNFPNCPRTTIYEASERDFRMVLVEDAVSGLYERGRQEMANIGVVLMSAEQLAQAIEKHSHAQSPEPTSAGKKT
jgi:nicotinamidase-related amidase